MPDPKYCRRCYRFLGADDFRIIKDKRPGKRAVVDYSEYQQELPPRQHLSSWCRDCEKRRYRITHGKGTEQDYIKETLAEVARFDHESEVGGRPQPKERQRRQEYYEGPEHR